jgi:dTDP-4-dehydrorhamnose reductase
VTHVDDLAAFVAQVVAPAHAGPSGIFHATCPEGVTRAQFAHQLVETFGFDPNLVREVPSGTSVAQRPRDTTLDTSSFENAFGVRFKTVRETLEVLKKQRGPTAPE